MVTSPVPPMNCLVVMGWSGIREGFDGGIVTDAEGWTTYWMRNNSAEYVNSIMGDGLARGSQFRCMARRSMWLTLLVGVKLNIAARDKIWARGGVCVRHGDVFHTP